MGLPPGTPKHAARKSACAAGDSAEASGRTVDEAQLDACVDSGTASEEWWKNMLLGYEEMPGYPVQITGEMEMA